jgi:hypothetical protein
LFKQFLTIPCLTVNNFSHGRDWPIDRRRWQPLFQNENDALTGPVF